MQLSLLATKPTGSYGRIPISKVVVLDPWVDPLPTPGPVPYSTPVDQSLEDIASAGASMQGSLEGTAVGDSDVNLSRLNKYPYPKLFVINSEAFTIWTDHFTRLQEIVNAWEPQGRRLATLGSFKFHFISSSSLLISFLQLEANMHRSLIFLYFLGFARTMTSLYITRSAASL